MQRTDPNSPFPWAIYYRPENGETYRLLRRFHSRAIARQACNVIERLLPDADIALGEGEANCGQAVPLFLTND